MPHSAFISHLHAFLACNTHFQVVRILTDDIKKLPDAVKSLGPCSPVSNNVMTKVAGLQDASSIQAVAEISLPSTVRFCRCKMISSCWFKVEESIAEGYFIVTLFMFGTSLSCSALQRIPKVWDTMQVSLFCGNVAIRFTACLFCAGH
jgi:hypothetical protein